MGIGDAFSRGGLERRVRRLGSEGLARLSQSRLGQRVTAMAETEQGAQLVGAAKVVVGLVADRVRDTRIGRTLRLTEWAGVAPAREEQRPSPWAEPAPVAPRKSERPPVPAVAPLGVITSSRSSSKEPIRTQTMARVLTSQGQFTRARSIYRELMAQRPGDEALKAELAALEQAAREARAAESAAEDDDDS